MHRGFVKIYRKIKEWGWYSHPATKDLFIHLLLECNHKPFNFMGYSIDRGSVVVGRKKLSKELGFSERKIRTALNNLKTTNEVTIKTTSKFSIISIVNYEIYQSERPTERPAKRPAFDQQTTTIKECKNDKNKALGDVVSTFQACFREFYGGVDYFWEHGKDNKLMAGILATLPPEEVKALIVKFFASKDPFVLNGKHTIGVFKSQINKLRAEKQKKPELDWDMVPS